MLKNNSLFYDTNNELVSKYLKENEKILPKGKHKNSKIHILRVPYEAAIHQRSLKTLMARKGKNSIQRQCTFVPTLPPVIENDEYLEESSDFSTPSYYLKENNKDDASWQKSNEIEAWRVFIDCDPEEEQEEETTTASSTPAGLSPISR